MVIVATSQGAASGLLSIRDNQSMARGMDGCLAHLISNNGGNYVEYLITDIACDRMALHFHNECAFSHSISTNV
jgi:hypothetical protein